MKISIIIPYYNGYNYLTRLIDSINLLNLEDESIDLIIYISDNSEKNQKITDFKMKNCIVLDSGVRVGYGKACNFAFEYCRNNKSDIVFIVNQDGYFSPGSLKKMITEFIENPDCSVVQPLLTEYTSNQVESFFTNVYLTPLPNLVSDMFCRTIKPSYETKQLCGACFGFKLSEFPFDYLFCNLFHMYFEDEELYNRMSKQNMRFYFLPGAVFHHKHTNTDLTKQTYSLLYNKRKSKLLLQLIASERSTIKSIVSIGILVLRNMLMFIFTLKLRSLIIEINSFFSILLNIRAIIRYRNSEK
jgi:GT2 family glycosyltransferase